MPREKNQLRLLRAMRHLTQIRLARKARIHQSRLSLIENSLVDPSEAERARIAKALGASEADIFTTQEITS